MLLFYENNASSKRKRNSIAGETVLNSEKKQNGIFALLEYFKRLQRKRNGETLSDNQLARAFNQIGDGVWWECELGAKSLWCIAVSIDNEIARGMQRTRGVVSWEGLAKNIASGPDEIQPVSRGVLRRHVMSTNGF